MNDDFLHALRRDPPPAFASELKRRLDRQPARSRSWIMRMMLGVFLIGGVAMAALLLRDRDERTAEPATVAHVAAPSAPSPKAPAASSARPNVANEGTSEPQPAEPAADDRPRATVLTSVLARPLAQALVEHVGERSTAATPRVMVMEPDEAFAALCGGTEFVIASRRMLDAELTRCGNAGIEVAEWNLGYQAVVLTAGPLAELASTRLSPAEVYRALARRIPDPSDPSQLIDNPNVSWRSRPIDVLGPSDAAIRELFVRLVLEPGCETYPSIRALKKADLRRYDEACHQLRSDGHYREVPLTNTLITQQLWADPNQMLVLGYSYYEAHREELRTMLDGAGPTRGSLEDGTYFASRPVYAYAARNRIGNAAGTWLAFELSNEAAAGRSGYLYRLGLVPRDAPDTRVQEPWRLPPKLESLPSSEEQRR